MSQLLSLSGLAEIESFFFLFGTHNLFCLIGDGYLGDWGKSEKNPRQLERAGLAPSYLGTWLRWGIERILRTSTEYYSQRLCGCPDCCQ